MDSHRTIRHAVLLCPACFLNIINIATKGDIEISSYYDSILQDIDWDTILWEVYYVLVESNIIQEIDYFMDVFCYY